mgnify:CR=1 FL=1
MNELTIIPQNDGFLASSDEKSIFFPNAELSIAGCRNCIWKLHNQCPYELKDDEVIVFDEIEVNEKGSNKIFKIYKEGDLPKPLPSQTFGICPDMIQFISSLADKNSTLTEVWEKFHVYKARLQESVDYADFIKLSKEVRELENFFRTLKDEGLSEEEIQKQGDILERLRMDRNAAKLWWARLNQHVITSMQKINDREAKQSDTPKLAGIHSSGTINFNITKEVKQIEENK